MAASTTTSYYSSVHHSNSNCRLPIIFLLRSPTVRLHIIHSRGAMITTYQSFTGKVFLYWFDPFGSVVIFVNQARRTVRCLVIAYQVTMEINSRCHQNLFPHIQKIGNYNCNEIRGRIYHMFMQFHHPKHLIQSY